MAYRVLGALVEHHHDVAAEGELDIDSRLGREQVLVAVQMRAEQDAVFGDRAETVQAEDLETARVGEDGARPVHETVEAAEFVDGLVAGAKVEMVRVGQDDARVEIVEQIARQQAFDRGLGPDRHEDRRLDVAMRGMQEAGPRAGVRAGGLDLERKHRFHCRIDAVRVLLILACAAICWAQAPELPKPVFPDDTQDPKQAGGAELLEAVCPGHVVVGKEIRCDIACPEGTGFANDTLDEWVLARVMRGHFLSSESDDAALRMLWCEPHSLGFGGTILLSRKAGEWTMLWYRAATDTGKCHKVNLGSGRQILVCLGEDGGQGYIFQTLSVEDLTSPADNTIGKKILFNKRHSLDVRLECEG